MPPAGGFLCSGASIGSCEERIQETLRQMIRSPEVRRSLRFPNFTMVGHHYVLPVAKDKRGEIQGSVLRTSASNETVYIEPTAIGEQSAQLSFLRARGQGGAKDSQLAQCTGRNGSRRDRCGTLVIMTELDLVHAKARLSLDYSDVGSRSSTRRDGSYCGVRGIPCSRRCFATTRPSPRRRATSRSPPPSRSLPATARPEDPRDFPATRLPHLRRRRRRARRPSRPRRARRPSRGPWCRSISISGIRFHILVVTGPNTGGKTVALKTVGLLAIMAQAGLHVPAGEGSQFPIFDDVLADIGDEQSLEQSLSTFSSHVRRITEILSKATTRSLVLLDELGAGTDPADGAALGRAILDELDAIRCRSIVTTHIGDLKTYAFSNPGAENAAAEFDDETLQPKYRLQIGDIGQSNALKIARQLRLSERVVARAESYLAERAPSAVPEWETLQPASRRGRPGPPGRARRHGRRRAHSRGAGPAAGRAARPVAAGRVPRRRTARLQPGDRVVVARLGYDRPGRVIKLDPRKKTAVIAIGQVTWNVAIDELIPQPVAPAPTSPASPSAIPRAPRSRAGRQSRRVRAGLTRRLESFPSSASFRLFAEMRPATSNVGRSEVRRPSASSGTARPGGASARSRGTGGRRAARAPPTPRRDFRRLSRRRSRRRC